VSLKSKTQTTEVLLCEGEDKRRVLSHWQRPVELCKELLLRFLIPGSHVLDISPRCGSVLIACYDLGITVDAKEVDDRFFGPTNMRLIEHVASQRPVEVRKSLTLGVPRMQLATSKR